MHRERIDSSDDVEIARVQYKHREEFASIIVVLPVLIEESQPDKAFNIKTTIAHIRACNRLTRVL